MLKLKNIKVENSIVNCDMLPEDSTDYGHISVNLREKAIIEYTLPYGYEWCRSHVEHAKRMLLEMNEKNSFQSDAVIMWY